MPSLGSTTVGLGLDMGGFSQGIKSAAGMLGGFAATAVVAASTAVIGLGVASLKMAGDFEQGTKTLVTGAGESAANLKLVSDGMLKLAKDTGSTTQDLTAGMFQIESAGFHGAAGLDVLKNAAEGAKVGNAALASVANGVTTAMVDYASSNLTAAQATNVLLSTVSAGKTNMDALATSMSVILPTAAAARVKFTDVAGAMATMTGAGVDAANAATFLKQMFIALQAPNSAAIKTLKELGLSTQDVSTMMQKSLPDTLQLITEKLGKKFPEGSAAYMAAIKDISGGAQNMQAMLNLTGSHMQTFIDNTHNIASSSKLAGNSINGWATVQGEFNFKLAQAKEVAETLGIQLGSFLLPKFMDVAQVVGNRVMPIITDVINIFESFGKTADKITTHVMNLRQPFDEGARAMGSLSVATKSIIAPFTESGRALGSLVSVAKIVIPPLDEGSRAVNRLSTSAHQVQPPISQVSAALTALTKTFQTQIIPAGVNAAAMFQKNVLPSLMDLASFVAKNVIPTLGQLAVWFATKVLPTAIQVEGFIAKSLVPIFKTVWSVLQHDVIPTVENLGETWMKKVLPPLEGIISKVGPILTPALRLIGWVISNVVGPAFSFMIGMLGDALDFVDRLVSRIGDLLGLLGQFKDTIGRGLAVVGNAAHNAHIPGFATGTGYAPSGMKLVGEHGPELIDDRGGYAIYPNDSPQTQAAMKGGGGGGNQYHVHVTNEAPSMNEIAIAFRRMEVLYG